MIGNMQEMKCYSFLSNVHKEHGEKTLAFEGHDCHEPKTHILHCHTTLQNRIDIKIGFSTTCGEHACV
jgi:hypothetical protein